MKKLVRTVGLFLVVALAAGCFFACGSPAAGKSDTIRIGAIAPLTGENTLWGQILAETCEMRANEINESGGLLGKKIEIIRYDTRDDAVETTNAARKAIQQDGVVAFVGTESSTTTLALAEVCEELGVPFVATCASNLKITITEDGATRPYSFRSGLNDPQLGEVMAQYAVSVLGFKTMAIIYNIGQDYSMGIRQEFTKAFEAAGGAIVAEEAFNNGDVDFRSVLTKIKEYEGQFDAVYIASGYYKEIGLICNQMAELGMDYEVVTSDGAMAPDIFTLAGVNCEGLYFPTSVDIHNENSAAFVQRYIDAWDWDPTENAAADAFLANDAIEMIFAAIKAQGAADAESIRSGLEKLGTISGVTGNITMVAETHKTLREVPIYHIENQDYVQVDLFMPKE